MNSINVIGRVHSEPAYALVGATNRPLLKFTINFTRSIRADSTRIIELAVIVWGNKAEAAASVIKKNSIVAISGEIDFDSFAASKDEKPRNQTIVVANTIQILSQSFTHGGN